MDRRTFLARTGAALALHAAAGCVPRARAVFGDAPVAPPTLAPVRVARDRVLRTVVGLRPFRRPGFRVEAERLDGRVLVHNYGHGGAGVMLSWGTAEMAAELLQGVEAERVAVIGAGAVGLATARVLQRHGRDVTIYARELPPNTTSDVAGATWYPSFVAARDALTPAFEARFERAARLAHRHVSALPGAHYGIRRIEQYWLGDAPLRWGWDRARLGDLFAPEEELAGAARPFDAPHVRRDRTFLIEPPVYLQALLDDVREAGGRIERRAFADRADLATLPERAIVNCTGLGARTLVGDGELLPIQGQLTILRPQPEVDYVVARDDAYMFPRRDGILLGGTFVPDAWGLTPDREVEAAVLARHEALFSTMRR